MKTALNEDDDICPECGASWQASQIPRESIEKGYYGDKDPTVPYYYSRLIGIEIRGVYDGVSFWQCPDCNARWDRWTGELQV